MRFKDFTEEEILRALKSCSGMKKYRCSSCPIFGKGFQGVCSSLLMQRAAALLEEKIEKENG